MKILQLVLCTVVLALLRPCQTVLVDPEDDECIDECPPAGSLSNVALKKPAEQSSTFQNFGADKAVDGNTHRWFWDGKSCTHTSDNKNEGDKFPWLIVDLQEPHAVHFVKLHSRKDPCCADRYHDIVVRVGNDPERAKNALLQENPICGNLDKGGSPGDIFNITCQPCLIGRYVSVQITRLCKTCSESEFNILTICELEVFGEKVSNNV